MLQAGGGAASPERPLAKKKCETARTLEIRDVWPFFFCKAWRGVKGRHGLLGDDSGVGAVLQLSVRECPVGCFLSAPAEAPPALARRAKPAQWAMAQSSIGDESQVVSVSLALFRRPVCWGFEVRIEGRQHSVCSVSQEFPLSSAECGCVDGEVLSPKQIASAGLPLTVVRQHAQKSRREVGTHLGHQRARCVHLLALQPCVEDLVLLDAVEIGTGSVDQLLNVWGPTEGVEQLNLLPLRNGAQPRRWQQMNGFAASAKPRAGCS